MPKYFCVFESVLLWKDPLNNFLKRDLTFNPDGILDGARSIAFAGTYAYICCDAGLVVVIDADSAQPDSLVTALPAGEHVELKIDASAAQAALDASGQRLVLAAGAAEEVVEQIVETLRRAGRLS